MKEKQAYHGKDEKMKRGGTQEGDNKREIKRDKE